MHVVAIAELATPIETEAAALAADLGTTAYEERLKLVAGLPAIVLTSADPAPAQRLLAKIKARGHQAVGCAGADVVPSGSMISMRRFAFEPDAITLPDLPGERLPYADVLALLRAMHATRTETRSEVTSKQFSVGRAIATGGLLLSKNVKREEKAVANDRDQVLYVFRASGERPWILRERGTQYTGLGAAITPSSAQNFLAAVARLRTLAPDAVYNERLLSPRAAPTRQVRVSGGGDGVAVSSASGADLLAHLLAQWIAGARRV